MHCNNIDCLECAQNKVVTPANLCRCNIMELNDIDNGFDIPNQLWCNDCEVAVLKRVELL